jgi:predicted nucleic acid-binding protein
MAKTGWLSWLRDRWGTILVPPAVWGELSKIGDETAWSALNAAHAAGWLRIAPLPTTDTPVECARLHAGETEAIHFALASHADWLLVDDGDARKAAKALGLRITGVLGMIVWAKHHGRIDHAMDAIAVLRRIAGFRISNEVIKQIADDLGEVV